jgi:hypothetical protein
MHGRYYYSMLNTRSSKGLERAPALPRAVVLPFHERERERERRGYEPFAFHAPIYWAI